MNINRIIPLQFSLISKMFVFGHHVYDKYMNGYYSVLIYIKLFLITILYYLLKVIIDHFNIYCLFSHDYKQLREVIESQKPLASTLYYIVYTGTANITWSFQLEVCIAFIL